MFFKPITIYPKDYKKELRAHIYELISFYIAQTKSTIFPSQIDELNNIDIDIEEYKYAYEYTGFYSLHDIIKEINLFLERNFLSNYPELNDLIKRIIRILKSILEEELIYNHVNSIEQPQGIILTDGPFYINRDELIQLELTLKNLINELKDLILKLYEDEMIDKELFDALYNELLKILSKVYSRYKIICHPTSSSCLGSYSAKYNKITLYKKAIEEWIPSENLDTKLLNVFSHELFHAFHHSFVKQFGEKWEYDPDSTMLKESIADFIEYKYALLYLNNEALVNDHLKCWNKYDINDFPYSGGKYYVTYDGLCELAFKKSSVGTKRAYKILKETISIKTIKI